MEPKIEKLKQEKTVTEQKLAQCQRQKARLESRIRYLSDGERKKRNHRLITRGAAVESIVPAVKDMGEPGFFSLMERVFSLPEVRKLVRDAAPEEAG